MSILSIFLSMGVQGFPSRKLGTKPRHNLDIDIDIDNDIDIELILFPKENNILQVMSQGT